MWTNIDDTAVESSILRDLADFDISAPIKVTVCFDTDCDVTRDILIKTENDTDSNIVENNDVQSLASFRDLKSKEEIKEEPLESHGATEQINNKEETGHILQEITSHQAEEIQNKLSNNDDSRKRKQQQLQIYKNKAAKMTQQKKTDDRTEKRDESTSQEKVNASTIESSLLVYNQTPETTSPTQQHLRTVLPNPSMVPPQPDVQVQAKHKANCQTMLLDLADYMRNVMEAYCFHKQYNTSKENFLRLKDRYFNLSYDTVLKIILPMEQNKEYIHSFLKETHRRAAEKSFYKCGYQDYGILLGELTTWVRKTACFKKQKFHNTSQPTEIGKNAKVQQELNQRQLANKKNNVDNLNKSSEVNSLCIFSSGSPGSEIRINIDPNINRNIMSATVNETNKGVKNIQPPPVSTASQNQSQNPCISGITARTNNEKKGMNAKKQPALSPSANMRVMNYQLPRSPEPNRNQSSLIELLTSIDIPTEQMHSRPPQEMQSLQSNHEIQQNLCHSANVPVQYGQSSSLPMYGQMTNLQPQHGHSQTVQQQYRHPEVAIPLHEQLLNNQLQVQSQYEKQQNMQQQNKHSIHNVPQYSQSQNRPQQVVQSPHSLHQYVQSQPVLPHYVQAQQPLSQTHLPNYNQHHNILGQPQAQSNHIFPQGGQIRPVPPPYPHYVLQQQPRNPPIQVGLPKPVHPCYEQPQQALPQNQQYNHASSQAGHLQQQANHLKELLDKPQRLEWPHEFTAIYSQPNMQQQIQKNTPRSASTDSGFISPLNFNVSTDQTVPPPPPPGAETSPLLITHVTSLNPKVSYIAEGECYICKKRTKKMCMGCMKYYYCSYDCQVQDWRSHQAICKAGTIRGK